MIDITMFTQMFTIFYFSKYIIMASAIYGMMRLIKYIIGV